MFITVTWQHNTVRLLDQTLLPNEETYINCTDVEAVAEAIRSLRVRGAPAIGITAAFGIALAAQQIEARSFDDFYEALLEKCTLLAETRPTAVNLFWAIERMKKVCVSLKEDELDNIRASLISEAKAILKEDVIMNKKIGAFGATRVSEGAGILTHCNAGALATGGYGTALGVIRTAWSRDKTLRVFADETRPVLQGARLTAWELQQIKIPVTLITDNMAGYFMKRGDITICIVGADRIARNGDVANKIGTYGIAVLAKAHNISFYVAAPTTTIDFEMESGDDIPIEERDIREVAELGGQRIAPEGIDIANPAFDVTPAALITKIITEKGLFNPADISQAEN